MNAKVIDQVCESTADEQRARRLMAMGQMAASLAHEIRNPLGSMELFCSLLKKDLSGQPDALNLAEQIHSGIKTLDRVISNCLQFARDNIPKRKQVNDITEVIDEAVEYARVHAEKSGVELVQEHIGSGPVNLDPYQMNQALLNLIVNAIHAAEAGKNSAGKTPRVCVTSDRTDEKQVIFHIADNGIGISEEDQHQMFDPFFSTKGEGTGLGLTIVHSIISAHKGRLAVSSKLGEGTTMTISLPRDVQEEGTQ